MLHKPYLHILFILFVTYTLVFAQRDTVAEKPKFVFKTSAIPTNKVRNSRVPLEFDLGNYMIEGKDYAGAIDMWQKCLQKDSRIAAACFNIGLANLILRKPDDARSAFERASELDPADAQTHIYLGKIYISINELNKAQSAFEKANELQSNDAEILNDLACVYDKQRKYAKALETINKAIAQKPDFLNANVNKLTFLNNMGLPDSV